MFSALSSLVSSALSPATRIPPSSWDPSTLLPQGSTSDKSTLRTRITAQSSFDFQVDGSWSHGTLRFEVAGGGAAGSSSSSSAGAAAGGLPSYDDAVQHLTTVNRTAAQEKREGGQFAEGEDELVVSVEARYNDEELWSESKVELVKTGTSGLLLSVKTPTMSASRLASQLSFHITISCPSSLSSLASLRTSGSQWRHLGDPSLSSLHFQTVSLSTTNAPFSFHHLSAGALRLETANAPIEGSYEVTSESTGGIEVECHNSKIEGTYIVRGSGSIRIRTNNREVQGTFEADTVEIRNSNRSIEGIFTGHKVLRLETSNGKIGGKFKAGTELRFKTANGGIEGEVELLAEGSTGQRESTPPLLLAEDAKKLGLGGDGEASGSGNQQMGRKVRGEAKTANGTIDLRFVKVPEETELTFDAQSANKGVTLAYPAPWDGSFQASTANASAKFSAPDSHNISWDQQSRTKVAGKVASREGQAPSASKLTVSSSNAEVGIQIV